MGGTLDIIKDGVNGWLVATRDSSDIADKLEIALEAKTNLAAIANHAARDAAYYNVSRLASETIELYQHICHL